MDWVLKVEGGVPALGGTGSSSTNGEQTRRVWIALKEVVTEPHVREVDSSNNKTKMVQMIFLFLEP